VDTQHSSAATTDATILEFEPKFEIPALAEIRRVSCFIAIHPQMWSQPAKSALKDLPDRESY